jgi:hypothetical protein
VKLPSLEKPRLRELGKKLQSSSIASSSPRANAPYPAIPNTRTMTSSSRGRTPTAMQQETVEAVPSEPLSCYQGLIQRFSGDFAGNAPALSVYPYEFRGFLATSSRLSPDRTSQGCIASSETRKIFLLLAFVTILRARRREDFLPESLLAGRTSRIFSRMVPLTRGNSRGVFPSILDPTQNPGVRAILSTQIL